MYVAARAAPCEKPMIPSKGPSDAMYSDRSNSASSNEGIVWSNHENVFWTLPSEPVIKLSRPGQYLARIRKGRKRTIYLGRARMVKDRLRTHIHGLGRVGNGELLFAVQRSGSYVS